MATYNKIIKLLTKNNIQYKEFRHEPVKTSAEAALVRDDISIEQGAKALIVSYKKNLELSPPLNNSKLPVDKSFAMIVVPGDRRFDSKKVRKILGVSKLSFASEQEVFDITNGVIPGGVPPFGNIFGIKTIVEQSLLNHDQIAFNAGDRAISIVMGSQDWLNLVNPEVQEVT